MKLITVDGGNMVSPDTPAATAIGVLYPGERMDLVVDRGIASDDDQPELRIALDKE